MRAKISNRRVWAALQKYAPRKCVKALQSKNMELINLQASMTAKKMVAVGGDSSKWAAYEDELKKMNAGTHTFLADATAAILQAEEWGKQGSKLDSDSSKKQVSELSQALGVMVQEGDAHFKGAKGAIERMKSNLKHA